MNFAYIIRNHNLHIDSQAKEIIDTVKETAPLENDIGNKFKPVNSLRESFIILVLN